MDVVLSEASQIMSYCVDPESSGGSTAVLAVGYVQSGKTLSFTTVTSLARDNGYGVVIVLAGTTNNLKVQSEDRLEKDLGLEDLQRDWRHFDNPDVNGTYLEDISQTLASWQRRRQRKTQDEKPAVLITLLKHSLRMRKAAQLFSRLRLSGIPVLVIDDESDQAGLNTKARLNLLNGTSEESGTYEAILELRASLPHHSYLQYTATPQANLLLAATDALDPSFAKVISAGDGYTGGQTFFQERRSDLVVKVPNTEVFDPKLPFSEPPKMLQQSLQVFLLGIAAEASNDGPINRSMMVQAHPNTAPHALYSRWVRSLLEAWSAGLNSDNAHLLAEVEEEFLPAYQELKRTVLDLPSLPFLLTSVADKISDIRVVIVNSTKDAEKQIKWKTWEYWILIGGQKLDRGFTVEGLTVTYMPRQVSDNADVLQQRARFFGYRSKYIDFCRVYLIQDAIDAFAGYVEDEEFLRDSLQSHEGQPLTDWKRDFILHRGLARPTRSNVVGRSVKKLPLAKGWAWPKSMHIDARAVEHNRETFQRFFETAAPFLVDSDKLPDVIDRRSDALRNLVWSDIPLRNLEEFLLSLRIVSPGDSLLCTAIEMAIARELKSTPDQLADVVFMSQMQAPSGSGRKIDVLRQNIHVGMSPNGATGSNVIYSGDRSVVSPDHLTLQLRMINLSSGANLNDAYTAIPWIAVHLPKTIENHAWLSLD